MTVSHVLARKYRPQTFADLIGQEALVQTITNAIDHGRLAHAYMLTGIRGIGKTTSARIIAKGLNCIGVDGNGSMTPNPCGQCKHCREIATDSHIDVIEIDAASNTGVDNVREIIEGAKYNPVSARYKIYIIDEVHMLSKAAFNALLKTLEEPPERIKFIFATTEIRKVPVTILSRCQRFDLKRLDEETLTNHLMNIIQKENATAEKEALQLIARAGDGSVRDSLSLLDQAITQFDLNIKTDDIRQMLGLSDRTALFDLYNDLMQGKIQNALDKLDMQYKSGADSLALAQDMLSLTHWLTRVKITPDLVNDITIPEAERIRGKEMAQSLSMGALTSAWQLLLKGLDEVKRADNPLIALEMVLIRLAYLSELPSPAQLIEDIKKNGLIQPIVNQAAIIPAPVPATSTAARENTPISLHPQIEATTHIDTKISRFKSITDMATFARTAGDRLLAYNIENYIRPVSLDNFVLTCYFSPEKPERFSA
ncbi:MAG: DNA polymerase III subunit gamma/tau, partial [Alphaproteobacteria bacterium]|nr:DNA polymerase III subunit gamma/tau [Alphaproteobacteria bacterium]